MSSSFPVLEKDQPIVDPKTGKPTWQFLDYLVKRQVSIDATDPVNASSTAAMSKAASAETVALQALGRHLQQQVIHPSTVGPLRPFPPVDYPALPPRTPINEFRLIVGTAAEFAADYNGIPSAFPSALFLESDGYNVYYCTGTAWYQYLFPVIMRLGGATSSFPALKRSSAILQARLADDSAYTDLEVLDEAYGAGWNGSVEVPTKNAVYDVLEALVALLPSGVYTPTLTNVANLTSTAYECQYLRVGSTVMVSGRVDVDPTAPAASTELGISLPIASNFGAAEDCGGVAFASAIAGQGAAIRADAANNRAEMVWIAADVTNQPMYFTFSYQVI